MRVGGLLAGGAGWPMLATLVLPAAVFRGHTQDRRRLSRFVEDVRRARPVEGDRAPL